MAFTETQDRASVTLLSPFANGNHETADAIRSELQRQSQPDPVYLAWFVGMVGVTGVRRTAVSARGQRGLLLPTERGRARWPTHCGFAT